MRASLRASGRADLSLFTSRGAERTESAVVGEGGRKTRAGVSATLHRGASVRPLLAVGSPSLGRLPRHPPHRGSERCSLRLGQSASSMALRAPPR
jgi:hypothetical protein